ncbi:PHD finger protein 3 [Trichoplax sp. H2]|nr:PHD finger protein 3 [Trichoplax sp. H2]|eukprot:RDD44717.1 PHD finger protein 3 [Trichoplax sp. H2]
MSLRTRSGSKVDNQKKKNVGQQTTNSQDSNINNQSKQPSMISNNSNSNDNSVKQGHSYGTRRKRKMDADAELKAHSSSHNCSTGETSLDPAIDNNSNPTPTMIAKQAQINTTNADKSSSNHAQQHLYCICQKPHNRRFMICCDRCEEWYHGSCVGINAVKARIMEEQKEDFICTKCLQTSNQVDPLPIQVSRKDDQASQDIPNQDISKSTDDELPKLAHDKPTEQIQPVPTVIEKIDEPEQTELRSSMRNRKSNKRKSISDNHKPTKIKSQAEEEKVDQLTTLSKMDSENDQVIEKHIKKVRQASTRPKVNFKSDQPKEQTKLDHVVTKVRMDTESDQVKGMQTASDQVTAKSKVKSGNDQVKSKQTNSDHVIAKSKVECENDQVKKKLIRSDQAITKSKVEYENDQVKKKTVRSDQAIIKSEANIDKNQVKRKLVKFKADSENDQIKKKPAKSQQTNIKSKAESQSDQVQIKHTKSDQTIAKPKVDSKNDQVKGKYAKQDQVITKTITDPKDNRVKGKKDLRDGGRKSVKTTGELHYDSPVRENIYKAFRDILSKVAEKIAIQMSVVSKLSKDIEEQLFNLFNDTGSRYKNKYRSLSFNLKDEKNKALVERILHGDISPSKLVRMTSEELANKELAQWREKETKKNIEMIKLAQTENVVTVLKKNHKGEFVVNDEKFAPSEPTEPIRASSNSDSDNKIDTTVNHDKHVFDVDCKICIGRIKPKHEVRINTVKSIESDISGPSFSDMNLTAMTEINQEHDDNDNDIFYNDGNEEYMKLDGSEDQSILNSDIVWSGMISMPGIAEFTASAYIAHGLSEDVIELLPSTLMVHGRLSLATMWNYYEEISQLYSKDIFVLRIKTINSDELAGYISLHSYLSTKSRCAVIGNCPKIVKDMYLIPVTSNCPLPGSFKGLLDSSILQCERCMLAMIISHKRDPVQNISTSPTNIQTSSRGISSVNDDDDADDDDDDDEPYDPGAALPYDDEYDEMANKERELDDDEVASPPPISYPSEVKINVPSEIESQSSNTFELNRPSSDNELRNLGNELINERSLPSQEEIWNRNEQSDYTSYDKGGMRSDFSDRGRQYMNEDFRPVDNEYHHPSDHYSMIDNNQFRPPHPQWRESFVPHRYHDFVPHRAAQHPEYHGGRMGPNFHPNFDRRPPYPEMIDRNRWPRAIATYHRRNRGGRDRRF